MSVLFSSLLIIVSCSAGESSSGFSFGKGKYNFKMTDSSGKEMLTGILYVKTFNTDNSISGTYEFKKISDKDFPGYSSMEGEFSGNVDNSTRMVFINTNPRIADANVFWNLKIKKSSLSGGWNYSTFRGKASGGLVKITK